MNELLSRFPSLARVAAFRGHHRGDVLINPGDQIDRVYFPTSGLVSLSTVTKRGKLLQVGSVGREGLVGGMVAFGIHNPDIRVAAATEMSAAMVDAGAFKRIAANSPELQQACLLLNEALLAQARALSACNAFHDVLARYASYLSSVSEGLFSARFSLTQDVAAKALGVRRTSITEAARKLSVEGIIVFRRGMIEIIDRPSLSQIACDCYCLQRIDDRGRQSGMGCKQLGGAELT